MEPHEFYRSEKFQLRTSEALLLGGLVVMPLTFWLGGWKGAFVIYVFAYAFARLWIDLIKSLRRSGLVESQCPKN